MAFVSLAIIAGVAFACPVLAALVPGRAIPETVFLLLAGAVLGPHMLGFIHVDEAVSIVSELGLAFLFLLAGYEINPKHQTCCWGRGPLGLGDLGRVIPACLACRSHDAGVLGGQHRRHRGHARAHLDGVGHAHAYPA